MSQAANIREKYGHGRHGKTYAQIGRESGVSRQWAQAVLSRKVRPLTGRKPHAGPARPFVLRLSREDELQCRAWARIEGKSLSVFLRDLLTAYCQQLKKGEEAA
jgi:hypothetical protein